MRAKRRSRLQRCTTANTSFCVQIIICTTVRAWIIRIATIRTKFHRTRKLLRTVRTVHHSLGRISHCRLRYAHIWNSSRIMISIKCRLVILRLHHSSSHTTSHIAHHVHGQKSSKQTSVTRT